MNIWILTTCFVHTTDVVTPTRYDGNPHNGMDTDHTWVSGMVNVIEVSIQQFSVPKAEAIQ